MAFKQCKRARNIGFEARKTYDTVEQRWDGDETFQRRQLREGRTRADMVQISQLGLTSAIFAPMPPALRAYKNTGVAPLTYIKGGGENTTKLHHLPGYYEAGGDSSQTIAAQPRDNRSYGVQVAEAARNQFAAKWTAPPPGFTRQLTAAQQHQQNLQWWIDKREECRQNWLDKREKERAEKAASDATAQFLSGRHPLGGRPSRKSNYAQPRRSPVGTYGSGSSFSKGSRAAPF